MNYCKRALLVLLLVVFSLPVRADLYTQVTPIYEFLNTPIAQDMFGSTGVQISNDGLTFLAASPNFYNSGFNDGPGAGYPFQYANGAWTSLGGYLSGPQELSGYGTGLSLSSDGNIAFLGFAPNDPMNPAPVTPIANVFQLPFGLYQSFIDPTGDQFSGFGSTGALSGNGYAVIIGAPDATLSAVPLIGEANFYTYDGSTWSSPTTISDPNTGTADYDEFSNAVAISADGSTVLIGSYANGGTVYLYNPISGTPLEEFDSVVVCQGCMALAADGQTAVIATDTGVTVYAATDSPAWSGTPIAIMDPSGQVAMSADGKAILTGTYDNTVYLYTLTGGVWTLSGHEFDGGSTSDYDGYGWTGIALSSDKQTVAISAGFATINSLSFAGAVYVYQSSADLSLSMTANPPLVALNQQVALEMTVTNNDAEVTAYNVTLTDTLPAGISYVGAVAAGGSCDLSGAIVTCTLTSLAPGGVWQPSINVKVTTAGSYTDTATVSSNQPDTNLANNTANASISMLPPTVSDGNVTTNQNMPVNGTLSGNNPCNCGTPVFSVVTQPSHGNVNITNTSTGAFTYTPNAGYFGSDSFTFQLANGLNTSSAATESITINALPPTVTSGSVTTDQDTPINGMLTGSNPCSCGTPVFSVVTLPSHGSVSITNAATGAFTYTPTAGYNGSDSFTFKLANGVNTSGVATESITVTPGGGGGGGGGSVDFLALALLGGLLAMIQRRRGKY